MTDKEIIKALEKIAQYSGFTDDVSNTLLSALDLINRQQTEVERLKDILYDADGVNLVNYWYQQCEIAENGNRNFDEENKKLKAEIEKLKNENNSMREDITQSVKELKNLGVLYAKDISKSKSEAIKEFAESLKEKAHTQPIFDTYCGNKYMGDVSKVYVADIDNLVKEMVGEE